MLLEKLLLTGALFDDSCTYRYALHRAIGLPKMGPTVDNSMVLVMLNPSTANETVNDPTIRKCCALAQSHHKDHLIVFNLFAYRSTNPKQLTQVLDPIGLENHTTISAILRALLRGSNDKRVPLIAAWGSGNWDNKHHNLLRGIDGLTEHLRNVNLEWDWYCFRRSKNGQPYHPLYLPNNAQLERWYDPRRS